MLEERLRAVPFFRGLSAQDVRALVASLAVERHSPGDVVFREGDIADALYLVETGVVEVRRSGEILAVLGAGSFVGELGLLLEAPRSADLIADGDVTLLVLTRASVERLLERHPAIGVVISRELSRRLVATSRHAVAPPPARVIAHWGDPGDLAEIVTMVEQQTGSAPIVLPAGEPVPATVGGDRLVIAVLPAQRTRESRAVLRAAEFVFCSRRPPEWIGRRHRDGEMLRCDNGVPLERAVRRITRRSVGLVLSSGGSKTVAHLGVAFELEQAGIAIDAMTGSSGGSIIAAAVAAGIPHEQRIVHLREVADLLGVRRWDFNVPPRTGLMKGRRLRDAVDRMFDGRTFDDLEIPLSVVATDLSTGREVVIESGRIADAVRASLGIPGAFDPWKVDGRLLIDGAIVNPLPASVLRGRGIDIVVASMVAGKRDDPSAPALVKAPPIMSTILRMVNMMERELIKSQLPLVDVLIRPEVATSYSFDFSSMDAFIAEGQRAAREVIPGSGIPSMGRSRAI